MHFGKEDTLGTYRILTEKAESQLRLDKVLANRISELSRSRLQTLIKSGSVTIDKSVAKDPSQKVPAYAEIVVFVPQPTDPTPVAQAIPVPVIYQDENLIVVDKPSGLVVHPAPGNPDRTLVNALLAICGDSLSGIGGVRRPGIVHRLDKLTSGVMVAAKTDAAHQALSAMFAAHDLERVYYAVVHGVPRNRSGRLDGPIGRHPVHRKKMTVIRNGKTAVTHYRVKRILGDGTGSVIECRLETGRTHQIRVHMADMGHAVMGDPVYKSRRSTAPALQPIIRHLGRQALHAGVLGFRHPNKHKMMRFESPLPLDMENFLSAFEIL